MECYVKVYGRGNHQFTARRFTTAPLGRTAAVSERGGVVRGCRD